MHMLPVYHGLCKWQTFVTGTSWCVCRLQVAAPGPLPGGSQVQIYDLAGFKLSMVNSELITLFKVRTALVVEAVLQLACEILCRHRVTSHAVGWMLFWCHAPHSRGRKRVLLLQQLLPAESLFGVHHASDVQGINLTEGVAHFVHSVRAAGHCFCGVLWLSHASLTRAHCTARHVVVRPLQMLGRFVQYYPARVHSAFVINAPGWFATPWKLLSSFLDAKTK
jgi:hypothetical protein